MPHCGFWPNPAILTIKFPWPYGTLSKNDMHVPMESIKREEVENTTIADKMKNAENTKAVNKYAASKVHIHLQRKQRTISTNNRVYRIIVSTIVSYV